MEAMRGLAERARARLPGSRRVGNNDTLDIEASESLGKKLGDDDDGDDLPRRRCGRKSRICGACCALTLGPILVTFAAFVINVKNANDGEECPLLSLDADTWDAEGVPVVEYYNCSDPGVQSMPLSMLRMPGSHNSYKQFVKPQAAVWGLNALIPDWQYDHISLADQLDSGVRSFELDVHYGKDRRRLMSFHLPVLDQRTSCYCLAECLGEIRAWSEDHPDHLPITVLLENKVGHWLEAYREFRTGQEPGDVQGVDDVIRASFAGARAKVFTPDDLRRGAPASAGDSLAEAVLLRGWPTVASMRGKIIFSMMDKGDQSVSALYRGTDAPELQRRTMFLLDSFKDTNAASVDAGHIAMKKFDLAGSTGDKATAEIAEASKWVRRGFLVRSRGNVPLQTREDAATDVANAILSGSQILSMDSNVIATWREDFGGLDVGICAEAFAPDFCPTILCRPEDIASGVNASLSIFNPFL